MEELGFSTLVKNVENALHLRCHSFEFDILLRLYEQYSAQAGDLWEQTHASSSTFYAALRKLADLGMIEIIADDSDRRIRRYRLADDVRDKMDANHAALPKWFATKLGNGHEQPGFSFQQFVRGMEDALSIKCLSYDFELVIYLFDCGPTSATDLHIMCRASRSTFHMALGKLTDSNVIYAWQHTKDRRKKLHDLTPATRQTLETQVVQIQHWWQSWFDVHTDAAGDGAGPK